MATLEEGLAAWKGGWLTGIWASVPTPLDSSGSLKIEAIPGIVSHYADSLGLDGVYCNGIMGEGWSLTLDERRAVLAAWIAAAAGRLKVGVVVTAGSLTETIELAVHARDVGAHHIVIAPPPGHYSGSELVEYVRMVHGAVSLPLVVVQTSSGGFDLDAVRTLAGEAGVVSAIKLGASHDDLQPMLREFGHRLTITDPLEVNWCSNLRTVGMEVLYADPEPYLFQTAGHRPIESYYRAFRDGNSAEAVAISDTLGPLREVYDRWVMRPLLSGVGPIGALKAWCEYLGMDVGPPRRPLLALEEAERRLLYRELNAVGCSRVGERALGQTLETERKP